jgi:predicted extracellular nuclease
LTRIFEIQGAGHASAFDGQQVSTFGIVTAVQNNGFYIQDPDGDGDDSTSDGIFVQTSGAPTVSVGTLATVTGTVDEQFGARTQIEAVTSILTEATSTVITPTVIGAGGRTPPTRIVDDAGSAVFDAVNHGRDFYESLEGMLVTLPDAVATGPLFEPFGEFYAVPNQGAGATGTNGRGGITIAGDSSADNPIGADLNPERIQIDVNLTDGTAPAVSMGDLTGDITGVVDFDFNDYSIRPISPVAFTANAAEPEISDLVGTKDHLTVATFNVLNLDPKAEDVTQVPGQDPNNVDDDVGTGQFARIAQQIVGNLRIPDIIGLEEVQDNDGAEDNGVVDANLTYETLIQAIVDAGGPRYKFIDLPPEDGADGGQPGANIRVGFLYNDDRVDLISGSVQRIEDTVGEDAFDDTRKSVTADFVFNGKTVTVLVNHFSSKGGSDPLFGDNQPPANGSLDQREAQADFINAFVDSLLAADPDKQIVVLGDFNEFQFFTPLQILAGIGLEQVLFNLAPMLIADATDLFSFNFEGNAQLLDHILVSLGLTGQAEVDIVHVNAGYFGSASDHDPVLARFLILAQVPEPATLVLVLSGLAAAFLVRRRRPVAGSGSRA